MSIPTIKNIEDALIAAIKAGMTYLRTVDTYEGELDEAKIALAAKNFPAVLIYMEKTRITNRAYPLKWQHPVFTMLVCEKNLRGKKEAVQGDITNPGIYQMLADLFDTLFQQTLGLEIDPFDIPENAAEEAVITSSVIMVYAAQYGTKCRKN